MIRQSDIKTTGIIFMIPSLFVTPLLSIAAYNFHMAKVIQNHPLAQQMLTLTVLLIGTITIMGLIGFLLFLFSKEIAGKLCETTS